MAERGQFPAMILEAMQKWLESRGQQFKENIQDLNRKMVGPQATPESTMEAMLNFGPGAIQAWHGSPVADIVKFLSSKIGTGQGAATYGKGLYTAEAYPTAHSYWDMLNPDQLVTREGKVLQPPAKSKSYDSTIDQEAFNEAKNLVWFHKRLGTEKPFSEAFRDARNLYDDALQYSRADSDPFTRASHSQREETMAKVMAYLHDWQRKGVSPEKGGAIYHVEQAWPNAAQEAADPLSRQHYLDLERPIYSQSGSVKEGLASAFNRIGKTPKNLSGQTGDEVYQNISKILGGNQSFASQLLAESGIPGNVYLDQGSRAVGKGTSNYVNFDQDVLTILRKILGKDVPEL